MSDLKKSIDRKVEELSQKIGETGCWQARKVIELRHYIANSDVDDIIKFVPAMIEEHLLLTLLSQNENKI